MNQVSRQTISRISQSDNQARLRRSVRQSDNPINQSDISQSQQSVNHVADSLFSIVEVNRIGQSISILQSAYTTPVSPSLELSISPSLPLEPSIQSTLTYN